MDINFKKIFFIKLFIVFILNAADLKTSIDSEPRNVTKPRGSTRVMSDDKGARVTTDLEQPLVNKLYGEIVDPHLRFLVESTIRSKGNRR